MGALSLHSVAMCHLLSDELLQLVHILRKLLAIESSDVGFSGLHLINRRRPL